MLIQLVSLREIPDCTLRLVVTPPAQNTTASVLIDKLIRPLPHISYHVHHAERTGSLRMRIDWIGTPHGARLIRCRHSAIIPCITPRIEAVVRPLSRVLPLPLMGQALSRPTWI